MGLFRGAAKRERNHILNQCGSLALAQRKLDRYKQKFSYDNFLDALYAAHRSEQWRPHYRWTVYECGLCGFIHVGRIDPKAILYMDDMVLPDLPAAQFNNIHQRCPRSPRTALPQAKKKELRKKYDAIVMTGLAKPAKTEPWRAALEQSVRYRGNRPFQNLGDVELS